MRELEETIAKITDTAPAICSPSATYPASTATTITTKINTTLAVTAAPIIMRSVTTVPTATVIKTIGVYKRG